VVTVSHDEAEALVTYHRSTIWTRPCRPRVVAEAAAVVCHGGSGTVLGTLSAGVPLIVVPLFADQADNARRVEAVGAGLVAPVPRRRRPH
jgi:UDP:flavonoid glycosyltransferase YjiC (YdhE family)